jgi:hypothetical protein
MADKLANVSFQIGAASLGLGAFSGTIDLLHACKRGYEAWRGLSGLDQDLALLRAKLVLQQDLLEQWQRDWYDFAVTNKASVTKLRLLKEHTRTVELVLGSVRSLIDDMKALREYAATGQTPRGVDRMKWVANETESNKKTLNEIESLLASLYRLLPPRSPNVEAAQTIISMSSQQESSGTVEVLLQAESKSAVVSETLSLRRAEKSLQEDLQSRVDQIKNQPPTPNLLVPTARYVVLQPDSISAGFRSFGTLDGKPALFEWKKYDPSWQGRKGIELRGRVDNLARLLNTDKKPEELLILHCEGYFDRPGERRYGFVFLLPQPSDGFPHSLRSMIDEPIVERLPTLEDRYRLAYSLGLSIAILHTAEWLHKSIRSHNVLFTSQNQRIVWSRPYLVGFEYSRPDKPDESSEKPEQSARFNLYRHPLGQGSPNESYRKEFDYYSFGVILLEIAMWRSVWKLWREGTSADAFKNELIATASGKLPHLMGIEYAEATTKCLRGDLGTRDGSVLKAFFIEVVEVIGRCTVTM